MKVPLRFQITEYDCGAVSLLNAISYLFDREKIPAELVRAISIYSLDCYDDKGNLGSNGTSREAIENLSKWMLDYSDRKALGISCKHLLKDSVSIEEIYHNMNSNSVILLRTYLVDEHYVLITKIDNDFIYMFDPYYVDINYFENDKDIEIILDKPFSYNRRITIKRFNENLPLNFSLGPIDKRECLIISVTK